MQSQDEVQSVWDQSPCDLIFDTDLIKCVKYHNIYIF